MCAVAAHIDCNRRAAGDINTASSEKNMVAPSPLLNRVAAAAGGGVGVENGYDRLWGPGRSLITVDLEERIAGMDEDEESLVALAASPDDAATSGGVTESETVDEAFRMGESSSASWTYRWWGWV